jgi:hypothetical protein
MAAPAVTVVGMRALTKDLARATDPRAGELLAYLQQAGREAAEPVAGQTRSSQPRQTGALAGDVRVTSSRSGAAVRVGRARIPYAGPTDFGGYPGDRPYMADGRYLFPAAHALAASAARYYSDAMERGLEHFGWTNTTDNPEAVHD